MGHGTVGRGDVILRVKEGALSYRWLSWTTSRKGLGGTAPPKPGRNQGQQRAFSRSRPPGVALGPTTEPVSTQPSTACVGMIGTDVNLGFLGAEVCWQAAPQADGQLRPRDDWLDRSTDGAEGDGGREEDFRRRS